MSYDDARVFLQALGGPAAPADFVGGLDLPYTVGPSSAAIEMIIQNEDKVTSIPNIIGKIPGSASAADDMPVLMGNHRDAWIFGAGDPNSGTASLLEVAKGFGALVKAGWQPRNTIYLLSWSGEEYVRERGEGDARAKPVLTRSTDTHSLNRYSLAQLVLTRSTGTHKLDMYPLAYTSDSNDLGRSAQTNTQIKTRRTRCRFSHRLICSGPEVYAIGVCVWRFLPLQFTLAHFRFARRYLLRRRRSPAMRRLPRR